MPSVTFTFVLLPRIQYLIYWPFATYVMHLVSQYEHPALLEIKMN
jgi:hypothetical protein